MPNIVEVEPDDARAWKVRDALETALEHHTADHTQCVIILSDRKNRTTELVVAGVDDFQALGLMARAMHNFNNSMDLDE